MKYGRSDGKRQEDNVAGRMKSAGSYGSSNRLFSRGIRRLFGCRRSRRGANQNRLSKTVQKNNSDGIAPRVSLLKSLSVFRAILVRHTHATVPNKISPVLTSFLKCGMASSLELLLPPPIISVLVTEEYVPSAKTIFFVVVFVIVASSVFLSPSRSLMRANGGSPSKDLIASKASTSMVSFVCYENRRGNKVGYEFITAQKLLS